MRGESRKVKLAFYCVVITAKIRGGIFVNVSFNIFEVHLCFKNVETFLRTGCPFNLANFKLSVFLSFIGMFNLLKKHEHFVIKKGNLHLSMLNLLTSSFYPPSRTDCQSGVKLCDSPAITGCNFTDF